MVRAQPVRTCVGCRARAPKGSLLRIARSPQGVVSLDPAGSAPGRGAYVHRTGSCIEEALRTGALTRALGMDLGETELGKLRTVAEQGGT